MNIEQEIGGWDGKSTSNIKAIYRLYGNDDLFSSTVIQLTKQPALQKATTWLLKHHFENDHKLGLRDTRKLLNLLPKLEHWEARLHILQCMPYLPVAKPEKKQVALFLRCCLTDHNKFARAWAYSGFYELSIQYPEFRKEAMQFFDMAEKDEAPSVKARIRNVMKKVL